MGELTFTEEDINRNKPVNPGYYLAEIKSVKDGVAKTDNSKNWVVQYVGLEGEAKGVPVTKSYNIKGMGFFYPVFIAAGIQVKSGEKYNTEALVGKKIGVHYFNKDNGGRTVNDIDGYCPADKIPGRS